MASSSRNIRKILKSKKVASPSPSMVTCFILCKTGFGSLFVWEHLTLSCTREQSVCHMVCSQAQPGREKTLGTRERFSLFVQPLIGCCVFFLANFDLFLRLQDNLILGLGSQCLTRIRSVFVYARNSWMNKEQSQKSSVPELLAITY